MATAGLRQLQAEAKPDAFFFSASYERPNSGFALSAFDAAGKPSSQSAKLLTTRSSGFAGTLPIFSRNQGSIDAAKSRQSIRHAITSQPRTWPLRHEVTQSLVRYQASQERVTLLSPAGFVTRARAKSGCGPADLRVRACSSAGRDCRAAPLQSISKQVIYRHFVRRPTHHASGSKRQWAHPCPERENYGDHKYSTYQLG